MYLTASLWLTSAPTPDWEIEIRKRYSQALGCETGEFPDTDSIMNRIIPICYEEGIVGGASDGCVAYLNIATEVFIKGVLSGILERTRSNGPNGITTAAYKRQLEREEEAWSRGELQKNANSLLPVEQAVLNQRRPLGMADLRLSIELGNPYLGHMPLTTARIMADYLEGELGDDSEKQDGINDGTKAANGADTPGGADQTNGLSGDDTPMDCESDCGWEGAGAADSEALEALLDDCLA